MSRLSYLIILWCGVLSLTACQTSGTHSPWKRYLPTQSSAPLEEGEQIVKPDVSWQREAATASGDVPMTFSVEDLTWEEEQDEVLAMASPPRGAVQQRSYQKAPLTSGKVSVALLLPLSGPHAELGNAMLQSAQLALFDVGSDSFELLPRDTEGTPRGAAQAARTAVQSGADLILGPLFSESLKAVRPVARRAGVPVVAFSTDWTLAGNGTYIMGFLPFAQVARVVSYAQSKGFSRIGAVAPRTDYGDIVIRTLTYNLSRSGQRPAQILRYNPKAEDLDQTIRTFAKFDFREEQIHERILELEKDGSTAALREISQLQSIVPITDLGFDALVLPAGGDHLRQVATLLSYYDVDVKYLGTGLWDDPGLLSENTLFGAWFAAPDPRVRNGFENSYRAAFTKTPPRLASLSYDAVALAVSLARKGETAYTRDNLTNPRGFAGVDGIFRFRPDGLVERGLAVLEVQRSGFKVIDPAPQAFRVRGY